MNAIGLLLLLQRPGMLNKKDVTVKYLNPSCYHHPPPSSEHPSRGPAPGAHMSLEKLSAAWGRSVWGCESPRQIRGQSSCDAQKGGQEEVGWGMHFLGKTQSAILDSGSSLVSSQKDCRHSYIVLFTFSWTMHLLYQIKCLRVLVHSKLSYHREGIEKAASSHFTEMN